MCLSTVYRESKGPENIVMSNVQRIDVDDDQVLLTDLMERQVVVVGKLVMVDLVGGMAIVRETKS
ncbi:MAG: CooT family nickel-binding protein [Candidatus Avoscillospira sp.]